MQPEEKQKKKWKTPHTFVILVAIIIIAAIATYLIPAGEFTRFKDAATGKTLVEAGSYHRIVSNPLNPLLIPSAIYTGIVKSASTITFMLIIGGAFEVITSTGALTALCKKLSKTFSKHKYAVIPADGRRLLINLVGTEKKMETSDVQAVISPEIGNYDLF